MERKKVGILVLCGVLSLGTACQKEGTQTTGSSVTTVKAGEAREEYDSGSLEIQTVPGGGSPQEWGDVTSGEEVPEEVGGTPQEIEERYREKVDTFLLDLQALNQSISVTSTQFQKQADDAALREKLAGFLEDMALLLQGVPGFVAPDSFFFLQEEWARSAVALGESYDLLSRFVGLQLPEADLVALTQDVQAQTEEFNGNAFLLLDMLEGGAG